MAVISGYTARIVIMDRHEPEHEVAQRLLELAEEKGYDPRVVEAQRGEHDAPLSFRVPKDVADDFDGERASLWSDKIENDDEKTEDQDNRYVAGDAYAADNVARAAQARAENSAAEDNQPAPKARTERPKAQTK